MKKLIIISTLLFIAGCESFKCDCEYVVYDKDQTTNYRWEEVYRSSWDASCFDEVIDESTYTDSSGNKWYSRTEIECK